MCWLESWEAGKQAASSAENHMQEHKPALLMMGIMMPETC